VRNQYEKIVILSACQGNHLDPMNTEHLKAILEESKALFAKVKGVYKGVEEMSFMVVLQEDVQLKILKEIAFETFNQESILYRDNENRAYLHMNDGSEVYLGKLVKTTEAHAKSLDAYTYLPNEGYFVCLDN